MIHPLDPTTFFVSFLFWVLRLGGGGVGVLSYPAGTMGLRVLEGGWCSGERLNGTFSYPVDITTKSFDSQLVLESIARSKSEVHSNGIYGVTFDLIKILKGSAPGLLKRKQLRLQFLFDQSPSSSSNNTSSSSEDTPVLPPRRISLHCLPKVNVKTGRKYYVFINKVANNQFLPIFTPELINRRNTKGIQSILCDGCGQSPLVESTVKQITLEPKEKRLRLHCKLRLGNPIPIIKWYKNNQLINFSSNGRYRLRIKRRQSILVIRNPSDMDVGVYRCQVQNSFGSSSDSIRITRLTNHVRNPGTTASTLWPIQSTTCPYDTYCLNGGTCSYYESISEYVCECPSGYKGSRCSIKEVTTRSGPSPGAYLPMCIGNYYPVFPCA